MLGIASSLVKEIICVFEIIILSVATQRYFLLGTSDKNVQNDFDVLPIPLYYFTLSAICVVELMDDRATLRH